MGTVSDRDRQIEAIVERYAKLIRDIVRRVAGSSAAFVIDDVEQEVIVALWRRLGREQPVDHPASYIYRAAVRETVRAVRRQLTAKMPALDEAQERPAPPAADPHVRFERRARGERLSQAIARLATDRRRAVRAHLAGYRVDEIMAIYGWTYQRARNLIARGMGEVRRALKEERDGES